MQDPDPIGTEVFRHLFSSVAEEMGVTLERTAFSPNIKERRDHSCALFDTDGRLVAQAAHIPVHLGAFPLMMRELVPRFEWAPDDVVICNDPFLGGTHLPDISVVSPVFATDGERVGFVGSRAHHADVGGAFAGSMGPGTEIYQEGVIIPPLKLYERGVRNEALFELICRNVRTPDERQGDLAAQLAANATGVRRLEELIEQYGVAELRSRSQSAAARSRAATEAWIASLSPGHYTFEDALDDDGQGNGPLPIRVKISIADGVFTADFAGTSTQQPGCVNATPAVAHSAVYYAVICLLGGGVAVNDGIFAPIRVLAPEGSLVNPRPPAAVAAGNVETSQRLVDVVFGALAQVVPERVPSASQGTMNNLSLGGVDAETGTPWAYYETLGGGSGGSPQGPGENAIHCHMSNTRNTPAEAMEYHYPLRVRRYAVREGSGGAGRNPGGEGVVREIELLQPARASLLTERRASAPYGLAGGGTGTPGRNALQSEGIADDEALPAKGSIQLEAHAVIRIETPGGGGWGV
jgi:N-methylhydantoinase B